LKNKSYKHGEYYEFLVSDSKKRIIRAAPFKDRIVHHSLCNIIEPIFDKLFIFDSYACRKGKGLHKAITRFKEFLRTIKLKNGLENYDNIYCLKGDIVKYFDSVDKEVLFELIKRRIQDKDALKIIKTILDSYIKGLPIGNLTSQLFANIYLHELDFYIKNTLKCKYYIRYMDDFIILDADKKKL
jgi:retron-type reverse transcriptase